MITQSITLFSEEKYGRRLPLFALNALPTLLPKLCFEAVKMAFEKKSTQRKQGEEWWNIQNKIIFLDHEADKDHNTVVYLDVPTMVELIPDLYEEGTQQGELWEDEEKVKPKSDATVFDLLYGTVVDIKNENTDSVKFDKNLLKTFGKLSTIVTDKVTGISINSLNTAENESILITKETIKSSEVMREKTPSPAKGRVVGILDMVRYSTGYFGIISTDGSHTVGSFIGDNTPDWKDLFQKRVMVSGTVNYRPSGKPLRIDADNIEIVSAKEGAYFDSAPKPARLLQTKKRKPKKNINVFDLLGAWPGNETDEELFQACEEMD